MSDLIYCIAITVIVAVCFLGVPLLFGYMARQSGKDKQKVFNSNDE